MTTISSLQNPLVKKVLLLKEKSKERRKTGQFIIEGQREFDLALKGGYEIETVLVCNDMEVSRYGSSNAYRTIQVTRPVYEKLAHRDGTEGLLAIAKSKKHALDNIVFNNEQPLILVAEAPEKPGNIGALLRTADAAGLDAVLIADPKSDLYNPNIIRSSVGCVFTTQIGVGSSEDIIAFLKDKSIKIYGAALSATRQYTDQDFTHACAIAVGTEATGLRDIWLENTDENLIIPMHGVIDSLNVSVSAAILIFEAKRQRL